REYGTRRVLLRNYKLLAGLDFVRIGELVLVGFEDFHVLVGVAVELLADFGKAVAGLNGVRARRGSGRSAACRCGRGRRRGLNIRGKVREIRINELDLVPDFVLQIGGWSGGADEELVAFHVYVLKLNSIGLNEIQYGLILQLQLLEAVCHWNLLLNRL